MIAGQQIHPLEVRSVPVSRSIAINSVAHQFDEPFFENCKVVMVCLTVCAHYLEIHMPHGDFPNDIVRGLYVWGSTFIIPALCVVMGYCACRKNNDYQTVEQGKFIFKGLFLPYIIWQILYSVVFHFWYHKQSDQLPSFREDAHADLIFEPFFHLWFQFALLVWRLIVPHLVRSTKYPLFISCLIGFVTSLSTATNYLALLKTLAYLPFFVLGFQIRNRPSWEATFKKARIAIYPNLNDPLPSITIAIPLIALAMIAPLAFLFAPKSPSFIDCPLWFGNTFAFCAQKKKEVFGANADSIDTLMANGTIWMLLLSRAILYSVGIFMTIAVLCLIPSADTGLFTRQGEHAMTVFLLHIMILMCLDKIRIFAFINTYWTHWAPLGSLILGLLTCIFCFLKPVVWICENIIIPPIDVIFKDPNYFDESRTNQVYGGTLNPPKAYPFRSAPEILMANRGSSIISTQPGSTRPQSVHQI